MDARDHLLESFLWELRRSFRELTRAADQHLEPLGIQAGDRALLEFLAKADGPRTLSELARLASVSRQHIHQALKRLPDPGWVEVRPDPSDRRSLLLQLSPRGRAFWAKIRRRDAEFLARLGKAMPSAKARSGAAALRALRSSLQATATEAAHD